MKRRIFQKTKDKSLQKQSVSPVVVVSIGFQSKPHTFTDDN